MADISKITLPSGTTYNIKDAQARSDIESIQNAISGGVHFIGNTTTELTDGATTNPITIGGESVTANKGDLVACGNSEYLWDGSKWLFFGDFGSLGALAFKDSASGSYTPAGTVAKPTFTGTQATITSTYTPAGSVTISVGNSSTKNYTPAGTVSKPTFTGTEGNISASYTPAGSVTISKGTGTANYTPAGTVSKPTFTGTEGNISASYTPTGSVTISKGTGTANYTPEGSVSTPTITVTPNTATVTSITGVGTLPSCTLPSLSATVSNENLTLGWSAGEFSAGTLPTKDSGKTVVTGIKSATSTQPSFTGTGAELKASFSGTAGTATGKFTPAGSVSQPSFTGTGAELKASFSGTAGTATGKFTPAGSVSQPTFTGTGTDLEASFTGTAGSATATYTPAGTNSAPKFTGTKATITVE